MKNYEMCVCVNSKQKIFFLVNLPAISDAVALEYVIQNPGITMFNTRMFNTCDENQMEI